MAESGRTCIACGRPIQMFAGITINDAAYHNDCWNRREPVHPQARPATGPDQARPSWAGHLDLPYDPPSVMPVVESLQLGDTRAA